MEQKTNDLSYLPKYSELVEKFYVHCFHFLEPYLVEGKNGRELKKYYVVRKKEIGTYNRKKKRVESRCVLELVDDVPPIKSEGEAVYDVFVPEHDNGELVLSAANDLSTYVSSLPREIRLFNMFGTPALFDWTVFWIRFGSEHNVAIEELERWRDCFCIKSI